MNALFGFSLRLLVSFVAAKLLLGSLELDSPGYLIGLSLLLTANLYWFDFSRYSDSRVGGWCKKPSQEDKDDSRRILPPSKPTAGQGS